jgi:hypothetical protein
MTKKEMDDYDIALSTLIAKYKIKKDFDVESIIFLERSLEQFRVWRRRNEVDS